MQELAAITGSVSLATRAGSTGLEEEQWDSSGGNLADVDSPPVRCSGRGPLTVDKGVYIIVYNFYSSCLLIKIFTNYD